MTAVVHDDVQSERVKGWFAEHEAWVNNNLAGQGNLSTLEWKKPGSGNYAIRYVIQGGVLMVWGDLECAVYRWSSPITWEFLASCDLQYFHGKCEASPKGREYLDYDAHRALIEFDDALKRRAEECYDHPDPRLVKEARTAIQQGTDEWHDWMRADGYKLFGPDWYEWLPDLGKEIAWTCAAHLIGIKMAVAQLTKKAGT